MKNPLVRINGKVYELQRPKIKLYMQDNHISIGCTEPIKKEVQSKLL